MKVHFLGTGTSTGVPQIKCGCETCRSNDPRDKRLRASVLVEVNGKNLLIDAGPDLRTQLLSLDSPDLDALLVTHSHFDHIGGLIDLRSYCTERSFPIYCQKDAEHEIRQFFPYCFVADLYPGVPTFDIHEIKAYQPFTAADVDVLPVRVWHYKLPMLGYRIGAFAYVTDCKEMPDETVEALKGVDTLVLNALRIEPHMSHLSLGESIELIERIRPRQAYLTHMSHHMGPHASVNLPQNVALAYDGLSIDVDVPQYNV